MRLIQHDYSLTAQKSVLRLIKNTSIALQLMIEDGTKEEGDYSRVLLFSSFESLKEFMVDIEMNCLISKVRDLDEENIILDVLSKNGGEWDIDDCYYVTDFGANILKTLFGMNETKWK